MDEPSDAPTYLDVASAAPWHPAAVETYRQVAVSYPGDPSRRHRAGRAARDLLDQARGAIAQTIGASADRVAFTSGGTEAVHTAVLGAARGDARRPARVVSSAVEHSAVLAAADDAAALVGGEHVRVDVDADGRIDLARLRDALAPGARLVNLQHANHEVGVVQPIAAAAAICREADAPLHVDACQTLGRLPVDLGALDVDYVSASAAKFGGGRGTGLLAWSPRARFSPLLRGDEREWRRRAGLEHLPGVAAMAEALLQASPGSSEGAAAAEAARADPLRRRLRERLAEVEDVAVHGPVEDALPHLVACSALLCDGEALVAELDAAGFAVHSGSSCATTSGEPSHVLVAMGALTHGHVRVSFGPEVGADDLDAFTDAFADAALRLRERAEVR